MGPRALLFVVLTPKTDADRERLARAVSGLLAEDDRMMAECSAAAGDVVIGARDELQLETIVDRLARQFQVAAGISRPQVAYREALTRAAEGSGRHVRQTGGRGEYAHAMLQVAPGKPGSGYVFKNRIASGAIPPQFIGPIDEGVKDAVARGVVAGYPIEDVEVVLYDGSYHEVDSSAAAFRIAGAAAFHDAATKAGPVLLEPIMSVDVLVPNEHAEETRADLCSRRGRVRCEADHDGMRRIVADVPLSETLGYTMDLRARTGGRATCAMEFVRYQPVDSADHRGDDESSVAAPRRPTPKPRMTSGSLPEPAD